MSKGNSVSTIEPQIWKSARLTIERGQSETHGTVFRFSGPLTTRDMYSALSPDAFRNIFEAAPGDDPPPAHTFDLNGVPYMDSTGLGMLAGHYAPLSGQRDPTEHYRRGPSCSGIIQAHRNGESAPHRLNVEARLRLSQFSVVPPTIYRPTSSCFRPGLSRITCTVAGGGMGVTEVQTVKLTEQVKAGGCASKLSPAILEQVLSRASQANQRERPRRL